jgi:Lipocalin-like domain
MNTRLLCALLASAVWLGTPVYGQEQPIQQRIVGTWKLVSTQETFRDGHTGPYPDIGPDGTGYLIYSPDGHMCVALMKPNRPKWHAGEEEATDAEKIGAASGFTSYCGTYKIDEENHIMFHYPEISFNPNFIGTEQRRPYQLDGNRLTFSGVVPEGEIERWTIVWERTEQHSARH